MRIKLILVLWLLAMMNPPVAKATEPETCAVYTPLFAPNNKVTDNLVRLIDNQAKKEIQVSAYRITSDPIINALVRAAKRGVKVTVIADRSEMDQYLDMLSSGGVIVYEDYAHAIHHNKIIVIDGMYVATGSFNFSYSAEYRNAENSIVIGCKSIAAKYIENFERHRNHSVLKPSKLVKLI